jgi:hypothetical protein
MRQTLGFTDYAGSCVRAASVAILLSGLSAAIDASAASPGRFVMAYGESLQQTQYALTPESVAVTSDGGYVALGLTGTSNGVSASWLLRLGASGSPVWQRELSCAGGAPGDYAIGISSQELSDGGYVLGGGVLGCGGSYFQRGLVQRLDAQARVVWAFDYSAGNGDTNLSKISQTADGGYIAAGSATASGQYPGAFVLKIDQGGAVQWQRKLGPLGPTTAYFNTVQQTADGGYVAVGEFAVIHGGSYPVGVLVASFDPSGNLRWQKEFNSLDDQGSPNGYEHALAGIQTSDGGYVVAGNWSNAIPGPFPQEDTGGALLLKLDSTGAIEWQRAYNGGIYCYDNGFNQVCVLISALVYSVHQTADGGYVLAGLGNLELHDSVPQVPWLAKVDPMGNLLWQYFYYDTYRTGRPISQYFASSTPTNDGGVMALGFTEKNDPTGTGQLYAVKTDARGLAGSCNQQHSATPLHAIDPGLVSLPASLPVLRTVTARNSVAIRSRATSVLQKDKCAAD